MNIDKDNKSLPKKCPYLELFWSECGKIRTGITQNKYTFYAVKNTFVIFWMVQCMLIKAYILIVVPQRKRIVFFKLTIIIGENENKFKKS